MAAHGREVGVFMGWWERLCYSLGIKLSPDKQAFAKEYLDDAGWFLFSQMSLLDQRHSLRVARYIVRKAAFQRGIADLKELVQAALLHDAGKIKGEILWLYRLPVRLVRDLLPRGQKRWAVRDKSRSFRYALYVDLVHATRGAYMAKSLGLSPKVVSLIKRHHDPRPNFYEPELALLQEANSRN
ncbi:MAG: HD domain-containing protein [Firmicutes bacterium]|jgi:putative nucleotidyltransferase with HDIG domain|nr:HD domain-containing protein [Bacillota bacterium]